MRPVTCDLFLGSSEGVVGEVSTQFGEGAVAQLAYAFFADAQSVAHFGEGDGFAAKSEGEVDDVSIAFAE